MTSNAPNPTSRPSARTHSILALIGLLLLCYAVAALGAVSTAPSIPTWYAALAKPSFNPPNTLFAPVWTALYGLMAIAAWLVWRIPKDNPHTSYRQSGRQSGRRSGLALFAVQLLLNALWTPVFFHFHQLLPALVIIACLDIAILLTTLRFWKVDRVAALLMLPYLAWVSFATALNYQIYRLN